MMENIEIISGMLFMYDNGYLEDTVFVDYIIPRRGRPRKLHKRLDCYWMVLE